MEAALIKTGRKKLDQPGIDARESVDAINLIYVSDHQPGITRKRQGKGFIYVADGRRIVNKLLLERLNKLVIPPAWKKVWICPSENGHLQVTGYDALNRKQYIYHPLWNEMRSQTKFAHLYEFGKALPGIREQITQDLVLQGLPAQKVMAAIVSIMECTCIRIGNSMYEKLYGSFGLTTLKDRHVAVNAGTIKFDFRGKKGIYHAITLKSRKLAAIVRQCRDIPGKELFQYYDDKGERHHIDSGMVNNYIREISGGHFTAKDFRTWNGSLLALQAFKEMGAAATVTETKKNIVTVFDKVAKELGNTRAICKKYYVHPLLIDYYSEGKLAGYWEKEPVTCEPDKTKLSAEEQVLMKIIK